ncbi:MAG TPA: AAA family ATPase [Acidimicrobiales bacterium]|jgi:chloramphenicol 3-O phosphotransferase|nr:AAA family ATPase [Acidimicrobiales bacterium]
MFALSGEIFTPRPPAPGRVILLHGASSSGKSTLARALQARLDEPFLHLSSDQLVGMLPARREETGPFAWWTGMRPPFFHGFHRCIPAFAAAGNDLVVDHVIELAAWRRELAGLLRGFDVFLVGVHCDLDELDRRERERGDRRIGEGRTHVEVDGIHTFGPYDHEIDTTAAEPAALAAEVVAAWRRRSPAGVLTRPE